MARNYRDYTTTRSPPWLQQPQGAAFQGALGDGMDAEIARQRAAVMARLVSVCPVDVLEKLGAERGIERGIGETAVSYRARLQVAWDTWVYAGTAFGLLASLAAAGFTGAHLDIVNGVDYSLNGSGQLVITQLGGHWTIDTNYAFWSRFDIVFPAPLPAPLVGPPAEFSDTANLVRRIAAKWKPAHATCHRITLVTSGGYWGQPGRVWGGFTWGADVVTQWQGV